MNGISKKEPVLIFGASGFIGQSLAEHLSNKGYDLLTPSSSECDLLNVCQVREYLSTINTPVRIIFSAGILLQRDNSFASMTKNIQMVQSLAECASDVSISSIIYLSTTDVYGNPDGIITEDTRILPTSYYGLSKYAGEVIFGMPDFLSIPVTILRIPGVYGPGDHQKGTVALFLDRLVNNKVVTIHGKGDSLRDYVEAGDVSRIIESFISSPYHGVLNVATGKSITILELVSILAKALGVKPIIVHENTDNAPVHRNLVFNTFRLREKLPAYQLKSIYEGIAGYVNSLAKN